MPPGPGASFRHLSRISIFPNKRSNQENALQAMVRVKKFEWITAAKRASAGTAEKVVAVCVGRSGGACFRMCRDPRWLRMSAARRHAVRRQMQSSLEKHGWPYNGNYPRQISGSMMCAEARKGRALCTNGSPMIFPRRTISRTSPMMVSALWRGISKTFTSEIRSKRATTLQTAQMTSKSTLSSLMMTKQQFL